MIRWEENDSREEEEKRIRLWGSIQEKRMKRMIRWEENDSREREKDSFERNVKRNVSRKKEE